MPIVLLLALVALLIVVAARRVPTPDDPPTSVQLESYLLAVDRRQKQLRKDHLSDW